MTIELLAAIIVATCPMPDTVETSTCHEYLLNCAVGENGKIEPKTVKSCVDKWHAKEKEGR